MTRMQPDNYTPSPATAGVDEALEQQIKARPRIICAECQHCKQFREVAKSGRYILKARCAKGHWRKGSKEETCDLHRVTGRSRKDCHDYDSSSDDTRSRKRFVEQLEDLLPDERHIHEPDGSFVDKTETMTWDTRRT